MKLSEELPALEGSSSHRFRSISGLGVILGKRLPAETVASASFVILTVAWAVPDLHRLPARNLDVF